VRNLSGMLRQNAFGLCGRALRLLDRLPGPYLDLLASPMTARADIEFTTRCNLRCVYCASLLPGYEGNDLDLSLLDPFVAGLQRRQVLIVGVSGHGETTTVRDWHRHCDKMLDRGCRLYLSTNLARELSDDEAAVLSRFAIVQVSCDTSDLKLFKELRRGGDFRTLLYNMGNIRRQALKAGRKPPEFWWHCVVSDRTVEHLDEHVAMGLAEGVRLFNFINLVKHADLADCPVGLISEMPGEELERLPAHFRRIFTMIRAQGATYICDSLLERLSERLDACPPSDPSPEYGRHYSLQGSDRTRDCLDPWWYVKLAAGGEILPCCRTTEPIGKLAEASGPAQIANNAAVRRLRESLLTGRLPEVCRTCNIRGWTSLDELRGKVALFITLSPVLGLLHRTGLLLPILQRMRRTEF